DKTGIPVTVGNDSTNMTIDYITNGDHVTLTFIPPRDTPRQHSKPSRRSRSRQRSDARYPADRPPADFDMSIEAS
ncbi:MAG: hypothetical protein K2F93_08385, partial [Muribaculaceae bacterium]|nr:hypothetical protein [Muribaculaceae bacterium]